MKKLRITVNGKTYEVEVEVLENGEEQPQVEQFSPVPRSTGMTIRRTHSGFKTPSQSQTNQLSEDKKKLTSPINGVVLEIPVTVGKEVKENDTLFVLEAMKMKTNISSPANAVVKEILVKTGDHIEPGQVILTFE